jgi:quinol monooxygenase YgiN
MSIYVRARFDVHDGREADFEEIALTLRDRVQAEPGTLTYQFYSAGAGTYLVLEEYVDSTAAIFHNERSADLLERVAECADMAYVELYGPIGPELREWVTSVPRATAYPEFPESGE